MKKLLFSALAALGLMAFSTNANAQISLEDLPPYKLGVTAGLNASSFSRDGFDGKLGFHVGANALFDASKLLDNTYVRAELLFQRKGSREEVFTLDDTKHMMKYRTCYLELPIHYGYACGLDNDWTIFGETGPYFAMGVGGRSRLGYEDENTGLKVTHSDKFFSGPGDPSNFDMGWGIHVGAIFQQDHQLSIGWDWGFINMNDAYLQNRNFMISYTYYFM